MQIYTSSQFYVEIEYQDDLIEVKATRAKTPNERNYTHSQIRLPSTERQCCCYSRIYSRFHFRPIFGYHPSDHCGSLSDQTDCRKANKLKQGQK